MELIEGEPAARVGLAEAVLEVREGAVGPILVREVGVTLLAASVTGARGFVPVVDFREVTESGDVTEGRAA